MSNVAMINLGCPKNQIDAEHMLARLKNSGYRITVELDKADAVIINTCGFINDAKQESIDKILETVELKKTGSIKKVFVTGCLAERYKYEVRKEIPEIDGIIGIGANINIAEYIDRVLKSEIVEEFPDKTLLPLEGERIISTSPGYAYLKISEGCDNCCSYCAIPSIRGRYRSRKPEDIIDEARKLALNNIKEIILVAQDTTKYGEDLYSRSYLSELLRELCRIEGIEWIRLLYAYPDRIDSELMRTIAGEEKIVKYLDIPIQHCNNTILKKMNRRFDKQKQENALSEIRAKIPNITLRTTVIVGFPSEGEAEFEELIEFISRQKFDRLGCFTYSAEEGTPAAGMEGQIDQTIKDKRQQIIMDISNKIMVEKNQKKIGKIYRVLVEGYDRHFGLYYGRTESDAPKIDGKVFFTMEDKDRQPKRFESVLITDLSDLDLIGIAR